MNVVSQPYSRPVEREEDNFAATVDHEIDLPALVRAAGMLDTVDLTSFLTAHPDGRARLWAFNNSRLGPSVWRRTAVGDLVFFYGNREVYAYATVASKVLWPGNNFVWPTGADWDYMYSLRDTVIVPPRERVPSRALREALTNFVPQPGQVHDLTALGTTLDAVLTTVFHGTPHQPQFPETGAASTSPPEANATASALLRRLIGYRSAFVGAVLLTLPGATASGHPPRLHLRPADAAPAADTAESAEGRNYTFGGDLNVASQGLSRGEQRILRHVLLGTHDSADCALCGRHYPTEFLRAVHIKRRSVCTDTERRDLRHIAMCA